MDSAHIPRTGDSRSRSSQRGMPPPPPDAITTSIRRGNGLKPENRADVASAPEAGARAMPQPRPTSRTTLVRLVLLALLGWALYAFGRKGEADHYEPDFDLP